MITWQWECIDYWLLTVSITLSRLLSVLPSSLYFFHVLVCFAAAASYQYPALSYISMRNALDWRKNKKINK